MRLLITIISVGICIAGYGQSVLGSIPDSIQSGANEIILSDHTSFSIQGLSKSTLTRVYRGVILNRHASNLNEVILYYSDFRSIGHAEITIYDGYGKKIDRIKLKDFGDYSTKGSSIASDNRAKYYEVTHQRYPYIIEVSYSISYKGSMFYPAWVPQPDENIGIVKSSLTIECDAGQSFRHKSVNVEPSIGESSNTTSWTVKNLKPYKHEVYSYRLKDYAPVVFTAPNNFEMDGYEGNLSAWDNFASWINLLNNEQNTLSEEDLREVKQLIPEDADQEEITRIVYEYLQKNTRYVSIQLGIGGWKPFETGFVHQQKYGDCKALSFYTKSLLDAVGVKAYYTLINAGPYAHQTDPQFPSAHFNHAILTVPLNKDTVWLECTSQTNPFGYLGTFTSNRNALMITETGGHIVHTRNYLPKENIQSTSANISLKKDGSATVSLKRSFSGLEIENNRFSRAVLEPPSEQRKWFVDRHNWGDLKLLDLRLHKPSNEVVPNARLDAEFKLGNAAVSNANRLFFGPFIFTNIDWVDVAKKTREKPLEIIYPFTQLDTLIVTFPENYYPEQSLSEIKLETPYGSFHRKVIQNQNTYEIIRKFILNQGKYRPEEYGEFREFIKSVQKHDRSRLVMLNKT